jgi:hypothetical protein
MKDLYRTLVCRRPHRGFHRVVPMVLDRRRLHFAHGAEQASKARGRAFNRRAREELALGKQGKGLL